MEGYSYKDSRKLTKEESREEGVEMGDYLKGLNVLEFDMGIYVDQVEEPKKKNKWSEWWALKHAQNQKLKEAIESSDAKEVIQLLNDETANGI